MKPKKITKTMLKLELKGDTNNHNLKLLDDIFNGYGLLVRISNSFVYHVYPCYARITGQEKLERLNELIKSLDKKAIIKKIREERTKKINSNKNKKKNKQ